MTVHQLIADGLDDSFPPLRVEVEAVRHAPEDDRVLVGRAAELRTLLDAYDEARSGHGGAVVISGEPGIGKTRLVEELVGRVPDAMVAWGRCPETGAQAAYLPCIQIARQLEGAVAFGAELAEVLLPDVDVRTVDPAGRAVALARRRGGSSSPRPASRWCWCVDDLQWADPASLRLIEFVAADLARTQRPARVTVRPLTADAADRAGRLPRRTGPPARHGSALT